MNKKKEKEIKKNDNKEVKKLDAKKTSSFKKKKKVNRSITSGIAYVYSTFNNTIISLLMIMETLFHGPLLAPKDLRVLESLHLIPLK